MGETIEMKSNIRDLRKSRGLTAQALADALGLHVSNITRIEKGTASLTMRRAQEIANVLHVGVPDLFSTEPGDIPPPNATPVPMEGASEARMRDDLPIYGTALGAPKIVDGEAIEQTTLNTGDIVHYARRPVILDGRGDAYGLYVQGDSMAPVHLGGDLVLAETKRPPRIGDDVVVYLRPNEAEEDDGNRARGVLLKRLVRRTASYVELEQYNPALTFRLPAEAIVRTDRVMRLADLIS